MPRTDTTFAESNLAESRETRARRPTAVSAYGSPAPARSPDRPAAPADLLALQRSAGNRTVTRLLRRSRAILRYGTGEHAQLGGQRSVDVNGVNVSEGELIALGDFYESPEQVYEADPGELAKLVALIRRDKAALEGVPGQNRVTGDEWQSATTGPDRKAKSYLDLAKENEAHFGPAAAPGTTFGPAAPTPAPAPGASPPGAPPPSGPAAPAPAPAATGAPKDHKAAWLKMHGQALDKAHAEAKKSKKPPPEAIAFNGFAGHFLTDAFAAGHLVAKQDIMRKAKEFWGKQKTSGLIFKESDFTKNVARKVLTHPACKAKLASKELKMLVWDDVSEQRFSEFLWQMAGNASSEKDFFNAFAKTVHDELNEAVSKGNGIKVENGRGDKWELAGDDTLALSGDTARIAKAAVEESYKNLEVAATTEGKLDRQPLFDRVWKYTPKPTKAGEDQIKKILDTFADASNPDAQDRFAAIAINNIDLLIDQLKAKGYMRDKPVASVPAQPPKIGPVTGPIPAPAPRVSPPIPPPPPPVPSP